MRSLSIAHERNGFVVRLIAFRTIFNETYSNLDFRGQRGSVDVSSALRNHAHLLEKIILCSIYGKSMSRKGELFPMTF